MICFRTLIEYQVIFVLTGNCVENENSKEFQEIASASTGQIFNILKNDVHLVSTYDFPTSSFLDFTLSK